MKPFRERNPVVVGAIGLVVIVAALLGAFQLDRLAALTGRAYQAAFHDASGLTAGNEVRVAGVRVGTVTAVDLARGPAPYVRVRFRVDDDGVRLGRDTGATIRIKTVLGQKYLALSPAGAGRLPEGGQIPLSRTAAPFDVVQAVTGLADTLDKVDTDQLAQAFTTLSATFADTPASVGTSLTGLSRLSKTVASRDAELRTLLAHARTVTGVLAERDEDFRKLVADGEKLLAEVSRRRDAIHQLLVGTNDLATQLSGLVADNRAQLEPALRKLRDVVAVLQRNRDDLEQTIRRMAPFVTAFANVVGNGRWFDSYVSGLLQPYQPTTGGR
ncbi:phospholipid/cholesterol/gamma-HCH transport system substrate-binding protein [Micromonospora rhizosphaerae]|uniref:Phospholipid/cholesterol/gamma-HCH transport system substrate-binding protein n=1 Tax=Micromonospora rhizosphaerae TaxID=568872 RepID=A0A1C6SP05_9ACTN|nr:MCE family protein [Micromonospora rhizosphaerae]SCL30965.1 phospholipid/cholesterol/gamma-HCH transport system substrate-binding protein [Micromonospora rhizosphaerae]